MAESADRAQWDGGLRVFAVHSYSKRKGHTSPDMTMTHITSETPRTETCKTRGDTEKTKLHVTQKPEGLSLGGSGHKGPPWVPGTT